MEEEGRNDSTSIRVGEGDEMNSLLGLSGRKEGKK